MRAEFFRKMFPGQLPPLLLFAIALGAVTAAGERRTCAQAQHEEVLSLLIDGLDAIPSTPCEASELLQRASALAATAFPKTHTEALVARERSRASKACARATGLGLQPRKVGRDGAAMALVPGGRFKRGADRAGVGRGLAVCRQTYSRPEDCSISWFDRETPQREIDLSAFYIDLYEVTNALFDRCVEDGDCRAVDLSSCKLYDPKTSSWGKGSQGHSKLRAADHPVACVAWTDARDYCEWAGRRLPTEAEWEKAARGPDDQEFPWGNDWRPDALNWGELAGFGSIDGHETSSPVGAFPQNISPYGAFDMAGNVWEWTADWRGDLYYRRSPSRDPVNDVADPDKIIRGGSWSFAGNGARTSYRYFEPLTTRDDAIGFRCAATPEED